MSLDDDSLDDLKRDDEYAGPKIARPQAASGGMQPLALRGLRPPSLVGGADSGIPKSNPGSLTGGADSGIATPGADLGSSSAPQTPAIRPAPIARPATPKPPSALDTRTAGDEAELGRLQSTGSGISQIQHGSKPGGIGIAKPHRIAGGILRGLETVGDVLAPGVTMMIPGTELHHNLLEHKQRGRLGEDIEEQGKQATAAKTEADTGEAEARTREADARTGLTDAQTKALGEPKPKEEKWSEFAGFTDSDGTPLLREENSGQVVRSDTKKPPSGYKPIAPKNERPDTPEQQFIDAQLKQGKTVEQAVHAYAAATQKPDKPEKPQRQLGVTPDGKVIEITPGMTLPEGTQSIGGEIKADAGKQAGKDALNYANDYMATGHFTGPGDEALMEKYFELAKPSSGFRMSQQQIEMLTKARDWMGGIVARGKHAFSPDSPYFSDTQRKQIVDTMSQIEQSKGGHQAGAAKDYGDAPKDKPEGSTGTLPDGTKVVVKGGKIVAAQK